MKKWNLILVLIAIIAFACQSTIKSDKTENLDQQESVVQVKDGLFIHVSKGYDDPHKVLMALSLAVKMSESYDVALFFDIEGVRLLTKTSEDMEMENFMSLHAALTNLIEKGVAIMACPMCLKKEGIEPDQLREGIMVAEKEKFFEFTKGRILTLDY